jgi:hypothetical protein
MAKYTRLTTEERTLGAVQIWTNSEANCQTFVIDSSPPRYPYNFGVVGEDILVDVQVGQEVKMDTFQGVDDRSLIYPLPIRSRPSASSFLAPTGLRWGD